jgi:PadR family transcriptional regulator, regulatory protein AphA
MSIRSAILGFLSWKPFTGYELKKIFADALSFHWSGNSNQIYGSLVELHKDGSVSIEVLQQEKLPAKKVYTITESGRAELREWLLSEPELPVLRSPAHIQLAWAESLSGEELEAFLAAYERGLSDQALMCREAIRRALEGGRALGPGRSEREALIWRSIDEGRVAFYENELAWLRALRAKLEEVP